MEMSGEQQIAAPRQTVWEALNDPEILKQCIPGCQHIEKSGDNAFNAKVKAKVGPVNATFSGRVTLSDLNPPESYTISGEGTGGAAGFAKGGAHVKLEDQGDSTLLKYDVDAQVGGKLAQLGQRLIKSTANKYARQFFEKFTEVVGKPEAAKAPAEAEAKPEAAEATPEPAVAESATPPNEAAAPAEPSRPAEKPAEPAEASRPAPAEAESRGLSPAVWVGGLIVVVLVLLAIFAF
ncbi:CoxG family protein [Ferruginivarius sediminum]|uniref:Carbon monoxide dehydrogenase n=1 Tax=Ferruginivarius sediminum TaxID=2661937 RepID=A0A369TF22_9PROT|nr:carbon monoxide dehydrogenase subunit G [Ferruginivarius sediminum]RDD63868.1 carbon monoxide dehydrogenase [Ferruginivarius sediminum]